MNSLQTEFSNRLQTLSDGRAGLRGTLHVEITSPSSAELRSGVPQNPALPGTGGPPAGEFESQEAIAKAAAKKRKRRKNEAIRFRAAGGDTASRNSALHVGRGRCATGL